MSNDRTFTPTDRTRLAVWLAREPDDTREARLATEYVAQLQADYREQTARVSRLRGRNDELGAEVVTLATERNRWRRAYEQAAERGRQDAARALWWRGVALYGLGALLAVWGAYAHNLGMAGAGLALLVFEAEWHHRHGGKG